MSIITISVLFFNMMQANHNNNVYIIFNSMTTKSNTKGQDEMHKLRFFKSAIINPLQEVTSACFSHYMLVLSLPFHAGSVRVGMGTI